jgi:hypothetical protein
LVRLDNVSQDNVSQDNVSQDNVSQSNVSNTNVSEAIVSGNMFKNTTSHAMMLRAFISAWVKSSAQYCRGYQTNRVDGIGE